MCFLQYSETRFKTIETKNKKCRTCKFSLSDLLPMAIYFILYTLLTIIFAVSLSLFLSVINARKSRKRAVGFFHPYTNDGGGGERVLWCAVKAIQEENPDLDCVIFTGDHDSSSDSLARRAVDRFGVHLQSPPKVPLLLKFKFLSI